PPVFAGLFSACGKANAQQKLTFAETKANCDELKKSAASSLSARRRVPVSRRNGKVRGLVFICRACRKDRISRSATRRRRRDKRPTGARLSLHPCQASSWRKTRQRR